MKLIKRIIYITSCFLFMKAKGMEQASMPFRAGFEFQMNGKLCEWALDNRDLQKVPIFTLEIEDSELCHVELDGPDIEFVTKPFSVEERHRLVACMEGIKAVIDVTKNHLNSNCEISFNEWLGFLTKINTVQIKTTPFFDQINERTIKKLKPTVSWEPSWQPQMTVQHPLQSIILLCNTLFSSSSDMQSLIKQSTPTDISSDTALAGLLFLTAHEMVGLTNSYLMPLHQNHLFTLAMALTMYFHGKDLTVQNLLQLSINALSAPELNELETHTLMRPYISAVFEQDTDKKMSLISHLPIEDPFIQKAFEALSNIRTFIEIANDAESMYKALLIRDTYESYNSVHQFDAKRWTNFMSRRPFSHMLQEILNEEDRIFSDVSSRSLLSKEGEFLNAFNNNISFADELPNGFHLANYAEQFYDEQSHPLNLEALLEFFSPTIRDSIFLKNLLKNGIFSTTMFSVMDMEKIVPNAIITPAAKEVIQEILTPTYTTAVLNSIEKPMNRDLLHITKEDSSIKIDAISLADTELPLDLLSPPFLLTKSDSMGRYRKGAFHQEYASRSFGSAIVEFRNIQQAKQLKSMRNNLEESGFLTIPDYVIEEASNVFDLLSKMTFKN